MADQIEEIKELIKAETTKLAATQVKVQLMIQGAIQAITWGSVALFMWQINRAVQQVQNRILELPDEVIGQMQNMPEQIRQGATVLAL